METKRGYAGIDRFRPVAALLVIAIHTAPLLVFGALPDFLFTQVAARVAVPFFLAATGYFVLAPLCKKTPGAGGGVFSFCKKTAAVYAAAILLYLPVNLYAGHFGGENPFREFVLGVLVNGTMYHLWYLPAALLGVAALYPLLRRGKLALTTGLALALYLFGLLGDSYYWVVQGSPALLAVYDAVFLVSDYTRNGLFYAPLFLLVGVWAAGLRPLPGRGASFAVFALALAAMLAEGMLLYGHQRHSSMYLLLPVCVFALFCWLLGFRGPSSKPLRDVSLLVYLLHPLAIIGVRGAAKLTGTQAVFVQNSLVHFLAVSAASFGLAAALVWGRRRVQKRPGHPPRAWAETDLESLRHNIGVLQSLLPAGCRLMPAVKADAYGHGAAAIGRALQKLGVGHVCVATVEEGARLRKKGYFGRILVLGYTPPEAFYRLRLYRLAQTVADAAHARQLHQYGHRLNVHIKVDTGMHRLGENWSHTEEIAGMFRCKNLRVLGIYTQLSRADGAGPEDVAFTRAQVSRFYGLLDALRGRGVALPPHHIQCSYGILNYPGLRCAWARPGLAIYGIADPKLCLGSAPPLRPVLSVKTRVALVKRVARGAGAGYGDGFTAKRDSRIAVLTMGYADGLPRGLSRGAGGVLINGGYAPFAGNICMDQCLVDVTDLGDVRPGDVAVFIGRSKGAVLTAVGQAAAANTIPNELLSRLGARLERRTLGRAAAGRPAKNCRATAPQAKPGPAPLRARQGLSVPRGADAGWHKAPPT